jgi:hypothetical protein
VRDDAAIRCRLLRSARLLLDWSQARLACEAGISTGSIYAVEAGRLSTRSPAGRAMIEALERGGVQLLLTTAQGGPGLRYLGSDAREVLSIPPPQMPVAATGALCRS